MARNIVRKSPSGRRLFGFSLTNILAVGIAEATGPTAVPDATRVILVSAVTAWPAGLLPANARLGVIGNSDVSQADDGAPTYSSANLGIFLSGLVNTNQRKDQSAMPIPTTTAADEQSVHTQFLSLAADAALAVGMTISLQANNPGSSNPQQIWGNTKLLWLLAGA